jgi:hypothetical protein
MKAVSIQSEFCGKKNMATSAANAAASKKVESQWLRQKFSLGADSDLFSGDVRGRMIFGRIRICRARGNPRRADFGIALFRGGKTAFLQKHYDAGRN